MAKVQLPQANIAALRSRVSKWNVAKLTKVFVLFGLVLALTSSYLGYTHLYVDDERRFWQAIERSMSTPSVMRELRLGGTGDRVVQQNQFLFSPQMASATHVTFDQKSALAETFVTTEGRAFPDAQYQRYTQFTTTQQADGSTPNLDDVLGKWEANIADGELLEEARLNYMSELVTLVVFGNFDADFRRETVKQLQETGAYRLDLAGVRDLSLEHEGEATPVWVYPVTVQLKSYVGLLNGAFEHAGYGDFPPLDPQGYQEDAAIPMTVAIDKRTGTIANITYQTGNRREEFFSGYGIHKSVERPDAEYGPGELEGIVTERLQGGSDSATP